MSHSFGNDHRDGYQAKAYEYAPTWEKDVDYNPDHQRSSSAMFIDDQGDEIRWVLQVKGLGVITMHAATNWESDLGRLEFKGVGIFTKGEIGYSPGL